MRDLSLHILDLIENALRAGATLVMVTVAEQPATDRLRIAVEDNGRGLTVPEDEAMDPFYTTKAGKKTGLGLSLFRTTAEQAGGGVTLRQSVLGGLAVDASMQLGHIDRAPLGDIAATISSVVCTNPGLDVWCRFSVDDRDCVVRISEVVKELPIGERSGLAVARRTAEKIKRALAMLEVRP